ncbi:hypothetical protein [Desulfosporosinus sp. Sb-LF]|uniref:hypothetical protein n=1 Tax=Desulfosporosinus sp. Sb-LF TaxID=2560027 RepID=UPI0013054074|nr:hypothetical protein [Desulfosporosinus sp. Sb-LF]
MGLLYAVSDGCLDGVCVSLSYQAPDLIAPVVATKDPAPGVDVVHNRHKKATKAPA